MSEQRGLRNPDNLTARLPGLPAAKPITTPTTQREEPTMNLQSVAPSGQIPKAIMADYLDATSGGAA